MNAMVAIKLEEPRRPPRPVPDDFEVVFVEQGRLECEAWYRARRTTITRWLEECGKERLINKRAAFVKHLRNEGKWLTRASSLVEHREPTKAPPPVNLVDRRKVPHALATKAAHFLRCVKNGGWVVWHMGDGIWCAGTRRYSAAELVDKAEGRGFDVEQARTEIETEERR